MSDSKSALARGSQLDRKWSLAAEDDDALFEFLMSSSASPALDDSALPALDARSEPIQAASTVLTPDHLADAVQTDMLSFKAAALDPPDSPRTDTLVSSAAPGFHDASAAAVIFLPATAGDSFDHAAPPQAGTMGGWLIERDGTARFVEDIFAERASVQVPPDQQYSALGLLL